MTTIEAIEQQIADLQKQVEELKTAQEAEKPWPSSFDTVWFLTPAGDPNNIYFHKGYDLHERMLEFGNLFRTEEDAKSEALARRVVAALKRQPGARGFVFGWDIWTITLQSPTALDICRWRQSCCITPVYFFTRESATKAIAAVGEAEIIKAWKWISGVRE